MEACYTDVSCYLLFRVSLLIPSRRGPILTTNGRLHASSHDLNPPWTVSFYLEGIFQCAFVLCWAKFNLVVFTPHELSQYGFLQWKFPLLNVSLQLHSWSYSCALYLNSKGFPKWDQKILSSSPSSSPPPAAATAAAAGLGLMTFSKGRVNLWCALASSGTFFLPSCTCRFHFSEAWLSAGHHAFPPKVVVCPSVGRAWRLQREGNLGSFSCTRLHLSPTSISVCEENTT